MATYWENSCSFGLRYVSWYKYLIVGLVFSHLGFWSGNLFLIAPFPDLCLLVPFNVTHTLKKSYKRPPHILSSSSESKIRSIKIHDHMNKPMSNSGSVSFCIPKCVILLTQTKHV